MKISTIRAVQQNFAQDSINLHLEVLKSLFVGTLRTEIIGREMISKFGSKRYSGKNGLNYVTCNCHR
jgi:hypothetical protein